MYLTITYAHCLFNYTHQLMKPQTNCMQVFCLVLSIGFLYKWHMYRKKSDPLAGKDMMYKLIHNELLADEIFDNRGCVVAMDAAFTSVKLARVSHACMYKYNWSCVTCVKCKQH